MSEFSLFACKCALGRCGRTARRWLQCLCASNWEFARPGCACTCPALIQGSSTVNRAMQIHIFGMFDTQPPSSFPGLQLGVPVANELDNLIEMLGWPLSCRTCLQHASLGRTLHMFRVNPEECWSFPPHPPPCGHACHTRRNSARKIFTLTLCILHPP